MPRPILADAFDHHCWATLRLLGACRPLTTEQLATTVPGTFGTIIDTLRHLVGADVSYLYVLSGRRWPEVDADGMDVAALLALMEQQEERWPSVLDAATDPDMPVTRHRPDGSTGTAPLGIRLAQVVHHGTDHRSQVATALTTLGIEPPAMDAWDFADSMGRLQETPPTTG